MPINQCLTNSVKMKKLKAVLLTAVVITLLSCSKSDNNSKSSCNEIVCGGGYDFEESTYKIYRGTLNPDTCGEIELAVNDATFLYYQTKWQANPEGYCCWEGLK